MKELRFEWDPDKAEVNLAKGSRKNKFAILAHRFAADLVSPRERNRRRSPSYVEDFAIEARSIDVVKMGYKNVKLFLREP